MKEGLEPNKHRIYEGLGLDPYPHRIYNLKNTGFMKERLEPNRTQDL